MNSPPIWRHELSAGPAATTVTLAGEIDISAAAELQCLFRDAMRPGNAVHVDLTEVSFIDSTAVGAMIAAHNEAATIECAFRVVKTNHRVQRVLTLTGVHDVLTGPALRP